MSREEFLKILRESLSMSLENDAINKQLDYYDRYISDEVEKGRTEKEVIEELGDPRLIAKTIKTVSKTDDLRVGDDSGYNQNQGSSNTQQCYGGEQSNGNRKNATYVDTSGIGCVIAGLVVFIIISLILRMLGYMVYGLGNLAFSGPLGFLLVLGIFFLLFGRGGRRF